MLWTMDSCSCQFEVDWDGAGKQNILRRVLKDCGVHGNLPPQALFDAARENNGRKNTAWAVLEATSQITADTFDGIWSFDSARVLHINLSVLNISAPIKSRLQSKLTSIGKIIVD